MSFLRSLLKDLVDKRLWPVALLLVAALAAVPMLIGHLAGGTPTTAAAPAPAATPRDAGTSAQASVPLDPEPSDARHDDGRLRDPFKSRMPGAKKTATATS